MLESHANIGSSVKNDQVINVAAVPHRSPFRYPGGKTWLVPRMRQWLGSLPAKPVELAEPFAGGAIFGLSALFEGLVDRIALVEMDQDVGAVWQAILNGSAKKLATKISNFDVTLEAVTALLSTLPETHWIARSPRSCAIACSGEASWHPVRV